MKQVDAAEVRQSICPGLVPYSPEWVAALIRRAAGLGAPCSPRTIREMVLRPLRGMVDEVVVDRVDAMLDCLVAHGDLLEIVTQPDEQRSRVLFYCAPPTFVRIGSGSLMLLGIAGEQMSALPGNLEGQVQLREHLRILPVDASDELRASGFIELPFETWARQPAAMPASKYVDRQTRKLDSAAPIRLDGPLEILNSETSPGYYKGRWTTQVPERGHFVAKRPQPFGPPSWCLARTSGGVVDRLIDLPVDLKMRGCDEAWQFQAALDAASGRPQTFRVSILADDSVQLSFFSPVPAWAQRRLSVLGPFSKPQGTLFAYTIPRRDLEREALVLQQCLWMSREDGQARGT